MENNLDDFFKDKLEKRNFRPQPGDWEAATQLIEAQEKNNRKRGNFFWCLLGALLLLFVGSIYWFVQPSPEQSITSSAVEAESTTAKTAQAAVADQNNQNATDNLAAKEAPTTATKEALNRLDHLDSKKNIANNGAQKNENSQSVTDQSATKERNTVAKNNRSNGTEALSSETNSNSNSNRTLESKNNDLRQNESSLQNNKSNTANRQTKNIADRTDAQSKKQTGAGGTIPPVLSTTNGTSKDPALANTSATTQPAAKETGKEGSSNLAANTPQTAVDPAIATAAKRSSFLLTNLPMNGFVLSSNSLALDSFQLVKDNSPLTRVLRKFKWSFGLSAGTTLYPHANRTQLFVGYFGGLSAKYRLDRRWSIQADLLYQQRGGDFESVKTNTGSQYSFGRRDTTFRLIPQRMHNLVLPITLQFKNGKNTIEAGFSVSYLLGVTGLVQQTESLFPWESANPKIREGIIEERNALILKDKFNTWNGSLILGYRYDFNTRWSVWGRGTYRLGEIFGANTEEAVSGYLESNPINLQIGATFYLF